jgi:type VI secretion system protein ImpG
MRQELLEFYEKELVYLRQMGGEFARKHPQVAGRLLLDGDGRGDPHVERLIQSFAFMAARVHQRVNDDFPQLSEALLNLIYPNYLRPVPSMTVVECLPDPAQGKKTAGVTIPRGTELVSRSSVDKLKIRFSTAYEVTLWPFSISEAEWCQPERLQRQTRSSTGQQAVAAARLRLSCFPDVVFKGLPLQKLRAYISGDPGVVYPLYELLAANCIEIQIHELTGAKRVVPLGPEHLAMAGFESDENILPFDRRSADGYRLLQEYFTFPEKFLFFDMNGLDVLADGDFGREVDIVLLFSRFERPERQQVLELGVNARTFRMGCTPAINLYPQTAEPILLKQTRSSYVVLPDSRHAEVTEIYSIDEVIATNPRMRESTRLDPIYAYRHVTREENKIAFWSASRKINELGDRVPSTVSISIVDLNGHLTDPDADVVTVKCTCSNFDLPSRLTFGSQEGDFDATGYAVAKQVTALKKPTQSYSPPNGAGQLWRLISHLSLNYLSLCEQGKEALQEILRLHHFAGEASLENQIGALTSLKTMPHFAMVTSAYGLSPARGTAVEIGLDELQFTGGSAYLFAAVLDRFLAGYASMNSFVQLTVTTSLRKEPMNTWPPRAGMQVLL